MKYVNIKLYINSNIPLPNIQNKLTVFAIFNFNFIFYFRIILIIITFTQILMYIVSLNMNYT